MPLHTNNSKHHLGFDTGSHSQINALENFRDALERQLLSEVTIRKCSAKDNACDLVIEVHSHFTLKEMTECLNFISEKDNTISDNSSSVFFNALSKLYHENAMGLDIMEISLHLRDTSIIIQKIYDQSIPDQLESIIGSLETHQSCISKKGFETPYEIYIPVFEEPSCEIQDELQNDYLGNINPSGYFGFWGLYFESEEDAVIYNVGKKNLEFGDLSLLNQ